MQLTSKLKPVAPIPDCKLTGRDLSTVRAGLCLWRVLDARLLLQCLNLLLFKLLTENYE